MVSGWHPIHDNFPWNGRATSRCCSCRSAYRSNASRLPSATGEISFRVRVDCTNIYKQLKVCQSALKIRWPLRACKYQNEYIESNRWIWEESRTSYFLEGPGRIRRTGFRFQHFRVKRTSAKEMHAACLQVIDASLDLELTLIHLFPDDLAWPSKLWASFTWNRAVPVFLKFCLRDLLVFLRIFWGIFWDLLESFEIFWDLLRSFRIFWNLLRFFFWNLLGSFWFFEIFWNLLESCEICSNLLGSVWIFGDLGTKWYKCGPNICPTFEC